MLLSNTRTQTHARTLASSGCPTFVCRWLVPLCDANALCTSKRSLLRFGSPAGLQIRRLDARFCDLQYNYCGRVVAEAALNRGRGDCAAAKGKVSLQGTVGELNWGKGKELISLAGYNVPAGLSREGLWCMRNLPLGSRPDADLDANFSSSGSMWRSSETFQLFSPLQGFQSAIKSHSQDTGSELSPSYFLSTPRGSTFLVSFFFYISFFFILDTNAAATLSDYPETSTDPQSSIFCLLFTTYCKKCYFCFSLHVRTSDLPRCQ